MTGRNGGNERFEMIFRRYYARVWRYYRACRVADDEAHDLAQEAFKRLFERMGKIRGEDEWPFLQAIARTVFLNWLRDRTALKRGGRGKVESIDDPALTVKLPVVEQPDHAAIEQRARRKRLLREAIETLPDGQRQSLELWLKEMSYDEIAKALLISPDAVKSRIRDAKRNLSTKLGEPLPEDEE